VQQLQLLWRYAHGELGHARDIAAGASKAGDEPELDRIPGRFEHDWNGRGG
jgi:hypothetical protein